MNKMLGDKKKIAALIVSGLKPKGKEVEHEGSEEVEGPDDALLSVSEDLVAAVKSGDAEAVASALRAAFDCLQSSDSSGMEDDEA